MEFIYKKGISIVINEFLQALEQTLALVIQHRVLIASVLALLWGVQIINFLCGQRLSRWGIVPRTGSGLVGIILAPLVHNGFGHLLANTIPLLVLSILLLSFGEQTFVSVSFFITLAGGLAVWLFASRGAHAGASGLIFGQFGYLLTYGLLAQTVWAITVAIGVALLYGGFIGNVLPTFKRYKRVSWESHLSGLLVGIAAAYWAIPEQMLALM
jgi:membrane associated rhomboid family serine protease